MSKKKNPRHKGKALRPLKKFDAATRAKKVSRAVVETLVSREGPGNMDIVKKYAKKLASDSRELDANVVKVLWFPDPHEIHLIELDKNTVPSYSNCVEPFYLDPSPQVPVPSGVAVILPDEYGKLTMPEGWGDWEDGQEIGMDS